MGSGVGSAGCSGAKPPAHDRATRQGPGALRQEAERQQAQERAQQQQSSQQQADQQWNDTLRQQQSRAAGDMAQAEEGPADLAAAAAARAGEEPAARALGVAR